MILVDGVMTLMIMIVVDYNDDDDDEIRMPHYARECQAANIALSSERSPLSLYQSKIMLEDLT